MVEDVVKKLISSGFVLVLILILCACGGGMGNSAVSGTENDKEETLPAESDIGTAGQKNPVNISNSANAALAKENVFYVTEVKLPELPDGCSVNVECTAYWEDKIYAVMGIRDWENKRRIGSM